MYFNSIPEITREVERVIDKAKTDFSHLNYEQLNWKPNANSWSVGQCLDHLAQSAKAYEPLFDGLIYQNTAPNFWRKIPVLPKIFGKFLLKAVSPIRDKKNKTFPVFEPAQSNISLDVIYKLEKQLRFFSTQANKLKSHDLNTIVTSPVSNFINYSLLDALNIVTIHNYRHFNQAKEVIENNGFPK